VSSWSIKRRYALLVVIATLASAATTLTLSVLSNPPAAAGAPRGPAPVGIVSAFGPEQAAILAEMHVTRHVDIDGYRYWIGTLAGSPVVDLASGEVDETAELGTYILDTRFHPRAVLFSGTAGAQNAAVHVGDVVVSGFVVDKSSIHYYLGGYQGSYIGEQVPVTPKTDLRGALVTGYGNPLPTPADAHSYGEGPSKLDKHWVEVSAFAAPHQLVELATGASSLIGTNTIADATGDSKRSGEITNQVIAGVVGQADVWTEPLPWIEDQNMLYPTDAEENEGSGFAFANAQLGVPWLLVRGISDSVWYPNAYDGVVSSDHAAIVVKYLIEHLPATISKAPETLAELSPLANAAQAGYLLADKAYFKVSAASKVVYTDTAGKTVTLKGSALHRLAHEYTYGAGSIG
jgi:adenosylhomocysteine nucleosidase